MGLFNCPEITSYQKAFTPILNWYRENERFVLDTLRVSGSLPELPDDIQQRQRKNLGTYNEEAFGNMVRAFVIIIERVNQDSGSLSPRDASVLLLICTQINLEDEKRFKQRQSARLN